IEVTASENASYRLLRRTVTIRREKDHRIAALVEVVSSADKDRHASVDDFANKAYTALQAGCHVLFIDLFPRGAYDPHGIHAELWKYYDASATFLPLDKPLTLSSYSAGLSPEVYLDT